MTNENEKTTDTKSVPKHHEIAMQLESIFKPDARSKRHAMYEGKEQARFVHYTSAEAALNIINTKRLWMRNTTCMSDYREVQHGRDMLNAFFRDEERKQRFIDALNNCSPNLANEAMTLFDQWWNNIQYSTYIASMSEHGSDHPDNEDSNGRLSMWRAFGGNTARVALVLKIPAISEVGITLNLIFSPVAYHNESEVHNELETVINNIKNNTDYLKTIDRPVLIGTIFNMLMTSVTCLKHEGFLEEREWRVLYGPERSPSPLIEKATEIIGGIPQIIYKIPLDSTTSPALADLEFSNIFDRLIIGPSPYPWAMYQAFVSALEKVGVPDAGNRVFVSGIPIRS